MLDAKAYKDLMEVEAPKPWKVYYARALSALRLVCPHIDEDDETVMMAIAMQIQYTEEYEDSMIPTNSITVGKFSASGGSSSQKASPYNMDAIKLLLDTGKCTLWQHPCKRCGCDGL